MAAIWKWNRLQIPLFISGDAEGWFATQGVPIAAPLSLQRVIVRADVSGRFSGSFFGDPVPAAGGAVRLQVSIVDDIETREYYGASRGVRVSQANVPAAAGGSSLQDAHWWISPYEADLTIRRAAPPPPANAMILTVYINFSPDPFQDPSHFIYPRAWAGDLDLHWLTSEPSTEPAP
jgi:hypothetical protein